MTLLHCLACDDLRVVDDGAGAARCGCGRSLADLRDGVVEIHGPCRIAWIDDARVVTTVVGTSEWPVEAPRVQRLPVPPFV